MLSLIRHLFKKWRQVKLRKAKAHQKSLCAATLYYVDHPGDDPCSRCSNQHCICRVSEVM